MGRGSTLTGSVLAPGFIRVFEAPYNTVRVQQLTPSLPGKPVCCSVRTAVLQRLYLPAPAGSVGLLLRPLTLTGLSALSAAKEPAPQAAPLPPIYRACNMMSHEAVCLYIGDNPSDRMAHSPPLHPLSTSPMPPSSRSVLRSPCGEYRADVRLSCRSSRTAARWLRLSR